jgi:hypothetical protein
MTFNIIDSFAMLLHLLIQHQRIHSPFVCETRRVLNIRRKSNIIFCFLNHLSYCLFINFLWITGFPENMARYWFTQILDVSAKCV